jgi:lysine-N-methylase
MKFLELEIFNDFKCIGTDCPFTCCAGGWRIVVDSETDLRYRSVEGPFGDRLKKNIETVDGTRRFVLTDDGRCPFLNEKNLCDIYINIGEDYLCYTCKTYPRYSFVAGDILFEGVSISCPEVARFFLNHKEALKIDFAENKEKLSGQDLVDWETFNHSVRAFTTAVAIAQDREFSVGERLTLLTLFTFQFQSYIVGKRDPSGLIELFGNHGNFSQILPQTGIEKRDIRSKAEFIAEYISLSGSISSLRTTLPELHELVNYFGNEDQLSASASKWLAAYAVFDDADVQIWLEQIIVYVMFRYFMQGFKDKDFYMKLARGIILLYGLITSTMVLHHLRHDRMPEFDNLVMIVAHSSRIVEHSASFGDKVTEHFKEEGIMDPAFLFKLFS